jgi:hypothetical protein
VFIDPLGGLFFGSKTLDYFRLAIWPENIDHPEPGPYSLRRKTTS